MNWLRQHLFVRQAAYALAVGIVLATVISAIEFALAYHDERDRLVSLLNGVLGLVETVAARAAFHVDDIQAATTLDGVMRFEQIASAKITTDLGVVLAERRREIAPNITDPVGRWLFGGDATRKQPLIIDSRLIGTPREGRSGGTASKVSVGVIELRASPELVGRTFLSTIGDTVAGVVLEVFLLGCALAIIFYWTLTKPLL
ncbi:MAG: hypothetical protein ACR2OX_05545, partial [Methyloligellaceae bacterium]